MMTTSLRQLSLLIALISICSCTSQDRKDSTLFSQEDRETWAIMGNADWRFEGGELVGRLDSGAGWVMTEAKFDDLELTLEFFPDSTINSGVYLSCQNRELSAEDCYEFNIWDLHPNQEFRTGAVVTRASPANKVWTLNQWNTYRIKVEEDHLQAWINDTLTVDLYNEDLTEGYIALQAAGVGEIRFRNVRVVD